MTLEELEQDIRNLGFTTDMTGGRHFAYITKEGRHTVVSFTEFNTYMDSTARHSGIPISVLVDDDLLAVLTIIDRWRNS